MPRKVSKSTVSTKYTLTRLWYDSYRIAIDYINAFMYKFTMYFTVKFFPFGSVEPVGSVTVKSV